MKDIFLKKNSMHIKYFSQIKHNSTTYVVISVPCIYFRVYSNYKNISFGLAITFDILPLLWLLGILPSLDACLTWLLEQSLLLLLGGSPMASLPRSVLFVPYSSFCRS